MQIAAENWVSVSKDKFFATVGQLNVHPRSEPDRTFWETPNRSLLGITTPGYLATGERTYRVRADLAKSS